MKLKTFAKLGVFVAALAAAIIIPVVAIAGYAPADRPTKTYTGPDSVAFQYPVFNSWVNTPNYGDERAFFDASTQANGGTTGGFQDQLVVTPGQEVTLRMYIHNGAAPGLNGNNFDGPGVARNTRLQVYLPTATATQLRSFGYIVADNTNPGWVADSADFTSSTPFSMEYVPGSAKMINGAHPTGIALSDNIIQHDAQFNVNRAGAPVGYQNMDGNYPSCFQYSGFVTLKVKINGPQLAVSKKVTTPGSTNWQENLDVNVNDSNANTTTSWLIEYKNTGAATATNAVVRDTLPANLKLVPGSVMNFDSNHPQGIAVSDTGLFNGGVGVGNIPAGANGFFRFRTTVATPFNTDECGTKQIVNNAQLEAQGVPATNDTASVTAKKDVNCAKPVPPTPINPVTPVTPVTPVAPVTPASANLPQTGIETGLLGVLGSSAMTIGAIKYRRSKKAVAEAQKAASKR
jgi:uncharacterized repeat protein (TIGR01451 family)/LPXTG-motif cell wall-anchored protein